MSNILWHNINNLQCVVQKLSAVFEEVMVVHRNYSSFHPPILAYVHILLCDVDTNQSQSTLHADEEKLIDKIQLLRQKLRSQNIFWIKVYAVKLYYHGCV